MPYVGNQYSLFLNLFPSFTSSVSSKTSLFCPFLLKHCARWTLVIETGSPGTGQVSLPKVSGHVNLWIKTLDRSRRWLAYHDMRAPFQRRAGKVSSTKSLLAAAVLGWKRWDKAEIWRILSGSVWRRRHLLCARRKRALLQWPISAVTCATRRQGTGGVPGGAGRDERTPGAILRDPALLWEYEFTHCGLCVRLCAEAQQTRLRRIWADGCSRTRFQRGAGADPVLTTSEG